MKHKKITVLTTLMLLFVLGTSSLAQGGGLPKAGLTPDSPFYFLETIVEEIGTFFTFGDLKKAERYTILAAERLAEAKAVVEKGKPEFVEKTLARYENQLNNSIARAKKAMIKAKSVERVLEIITKVGKGTSVHLEILAEVYEKVPEQAKPAIEKAMGVSIRGHEKAVRILQARNALGEVPETVSLPAKIPTEVRERIQMKVQIQRKVQEELEKVLQDFESLRAFCIEKGGPSEMCEKIPLGGFKSFKALEAFCLEEGGPPEFCTSFEAKCKEFGIITADECFLALSTVTLSTVTVEAAPIPGKTREELRIQREAEEAQRRRETEEVLRKDEENVGDNSGGIGAEIGIKNGQLVIVAPLEDSPAERAGLRAGDKILAIDGESTAGIAIVDAVEKISGEIGTKVILIILRNKNGEENIRYNISVFRK